MHIPTRRRALAAVAVSLAIVPLAGCGSSSKSGGGASADPATLMPAGAPLYIEATVRPSAGQRTAFDALSQKILGVANPEAKIVGLIDKNATKNGVTFDNDIKPWLGDKIALALTSFNNLQHPDFAAVIDTSDPGKAMDAIKKGSKYPIKGTVNGVDYIAQADGTRVGTISDEIVIGTAKGFAQVAAAQKGAKLSADKSFSQARAKAPSERLAYLYLDTDQFLGLVAKQTASLSDQVGSLKGLFGGVSAVSAALVAKPSAIEIDASAVGSKPAPAAGPSAFPLGKAPADAWAALTVHHLGSTANNLLTNLGKIGASTKGQDFNQILSQLKATTGLDVQKDLLSWMGDAAVFVRGTSAATLGGAVLIHSTNPAASAAAIEKLKRLLVTIGRTPTTIQNGFEVATSATGPKVQVISSGSTFVIALGDGALDDALTPNGTLDSIPNFQAAAASLGTVQPSLYVNLQTVFSLVEGLAGSNANLAKVKPYLDSFTSLIAGGSQGDYKIEINVK